MNHDLLLLGAADTVGALKNRCRVAMLGGDFDNLSIIATIVRRCRELDACSLFHSRLRLQTAGY